MSKNFTQSLLRATRMTSMGRLMGATRLIQKALLKASVGAKPLPPSGRPSAFKGTLIGTPNRAKATIAAEITETIAPRQTGTKARSARDSFEAGQFKFEGKLYPYRLYLPPPVVKSTNSEQNTRMPLMVLLHGCTQNAQDFARGTAMNDLAGQHHAMVLYPEQISKSNSARCWNWFEPGHQQAGRGEPGMIAALTLHVLATHPDPQGADPSRVYIAGLSAGGAMAAVVAGLHPETFAAVGVPSGLAAGAAQDMVSAFIAMHSGAKSHAPDKTSALPTIVFHGTADKTVHPDNGEHIISAAVATLKASGLALIETCTTEGEAKGNKGQSAQRTQYSTPDGTSYAEHWLVGGGPHAWSGGNAAGSYTDPDGPSASKAMLAFFLQHCKS